jgi:hypothetical protein
MIENNKLKIFVNFLNGAVMIGSIFYVNFNIEVISSKDIIFFAVSTCFIIFYFCLYGFINKKLYINILE